MWDDAFAFIMFVGAAGLAFGTLWLGMNPPGEALYHDGVVKAGLSGVSMVIGAAIMFLKGKK